MEYIDGVTCSIDTPLCAQMVARKTLRDWHENTPMKRVAPAKPETDLDSDKKNINPIRVKKRETIHPDEELPYLDDPQ